MKKLAIILLILPFSANAGWPFDEPPYAFVGVDARELNTKFPVFCQKSVGTANIGFGQQLYKNESVEINAQFTHISCIQEVDDFNTYNAVGVQAKFYLWNK